MRTVSELAWGLGDDTPGMGSESGEGGNLVPVSAIKLARAYSACARPSPPGTLRSAHRYILYVLCEFVVRPLERLLPVRHRKKL